MIGMYDGKKHITFSLFQPNVHNERETALDKITGVYCVREKNES